MLHNHQFIYDEQERLKKLNPTKILQAINLKTGMTLVDLGSNDGFFSLPAAEIVGDSGLVYAIDIDTDSLRRLTRKLDINQVGNVVIVNSSAEEAINITDQADIVFLWTVLHDFGDPIKALSNAKKMLKRSSGLIHNFDWIKKQSTYGPPYSIRFSQDQVIKLAAQAGLKLVNQEVINDDYYLVTLSA